MIPYPDPVVWHLLSSVLPDLSGRVSDTLDDTLPAARVTKVGDHEAPSTWEAAPLYQVEIWADDAFTAGHLAWDVLVNAWPTAKRETVSFPLGAGDEMTPYALVHGRWIEVHPNPSPDRDTGLARYLVTVGIRLSGVNT